MHRAAVLPLSLAVLMTASAFAQAPSPNPPPAAVLTADECAVWARELSFARSVADHDPAAFAAHLHRDAAFGASQPAPTRGRDAITQRWGGIIAGRALALAWYPSRVTVGPANANAAGAGRAGDIAWSSGPSLLEDRAPGATARYLLGGFHSVWHRDDDGVWRVLFDDGIEPKPATQAEVAAFHAGRRTACPQR